MPICVSMFLTKIIARAKFARGRQLFAEGVEIPTLFTYASHSFLTFHESIIFLGAGLNIVTKFVHKPSRQRLAIKSLYNPISRLDGQDPWNSKRFKKVEQEIENSKIISDCPNIVYFYGFCVQELQVLQCMELMDLSL